MTHLNSVNSGTGGVSIPTRLPLLLVNIYSDMVKHTELLQQLTSVGRWHVRTLQTPLERKKNQKEKKKKQEERERKMNSININNNNKMRKKSERKWKMFIAQHRTLLLSLFETILVN